MATLHLVVFALVFGGAACGETVDPRDDPDAGDAGPDADGGEPLEYDCANLPEGPFDLVFLDTDVAIEDLAFDDEGFVYGLRFAGPGIFRAPYDGPAELFAPSTSFFAGMDFLPNGHLVVADVERNLLVRFDEKGVEHIVLSGLSYPNGVTVGMDGLVYFTEHSAGRVNRVDAMTSEREVLVEPGTISNPNGITFSQDYRTLYIGEFSADQLLWKLPFDEEGRPGEAELFVTVPAELDPGAGLDGLGVDACGNVYAAPYFGEVYRIRPDGSDMHVLIDLQDKASVANMEWGTGIGGWDPMSIYFPRGGVLEVTVGVPGKPRPFP